MDKKKIAEQISDILPDRTQTPGFNAPRSVGIEAEANKIKQKQDAKELARLKYLEKSRLKRAKAEQEKAAALGITVENGQTLHQAKKIAEHEEKIKAIEAIEAQTVSPLDAVELSENTRPHTYSSTVTNAIQLQGTSRPEILKLLTSLNINLSVQLTKQDTANLLACLLTCNESQLTALMNNKKVPVVIKTVIKRLIEDMKLGNIDTVEKLWDRVFGKGAMQLDLPEQQQLQTGILPNVPISREAYIVIRDTLIK